MKKSASLLLGLLLSTFLVAQKESNIWVMGDSLGLDFNTTPPTTFTSGMFAFEACASVSDKNGNLLFYTNGEEVYNKNHSIMPNGNGLQGDLNTSQTIIIPKPKSGSIYYIITSQAQGGTIGSATGMRYTEVDMTLNGGLGDVTTAKNKSIHGGSTERMTAIMHKNNVDIWLIGQSYIDFRVYKISCNGIDVTSPVKSPLYKPIQTTGDYEQTIGNLKASHDGTRLACTAQQNDAAVQDTGRIVLYDFNRADGSITNPMAFFSRLPYGIEFSPSNRFLYVATTLDTSQFRESNVFQYDLWESTQEAIDNSKVIVSENNQIGKSGLQLGPNGKIYVAVGEAPFITAIRNPDEKGAACNYALIDQFITSGDTVMLGFPQPIVSSIPTVVELCAGDVFSFNNIDYSEAGIYYDTVASSAQCDSVINHFEIVLIERPSIDSFLTYMDCDSVELPEISGANLTGSEAFYTAPRGNGSMYLPGDLIGIDLTLYAYDQSMENCYAEMPLVIGQCFGDFPNIFTPNGDNLNELFELKLPDVELYDLSVFNRWGKLIYQQDSYTNDWDAQGVEDGTYYYIVSHQKLKERYTGWVSIVR